MTTTLGHVLDDPIRASLYGAHARFRIGDGEIVRYRPDVTRFVGNPPHLTARHFDALRTLVQPGRPISVRARSADIPDDWTLIDQITIVQYDGSALLTRPDPEAVELGAGDVDEILDLIERTKPGPYERRTIELGTYLGLRDDAGRLIALAGERLHPPGWTEISAVCTDPAVRGQGLATRLIRAVGQHIRAHGDTPFLHTAATNESARALYEHLGFRLRTSIPLLFLQPSDQVRAA